MADELLNGLFCKISKINFKLLSFSFLKLEPAIEIYYNLSTDAFIKDADYSSIRSMDF